MAFQYLSRFRPFILIWILTFLGCENTQEPDIETALQHAGFCYTNFVYHEGHGPTGWKDILSIFRDSSAVVNTEFFEEDAEFLEEAGIVMHWGAEYDDGLYNTVENIDDSNYVLAYLITAKEKGGLVLFFDGMTATLTADELNKRLTQQANDEVVHEKRQLTEDEPTRDEITEKEVEQNQKQDHEFATEDFVPRYSGKNIHRKSKITSVSLGYLKDGEQKGKFTGVLLATKKGRHLFKILEERNNYCDVMELKFRAPVKLLAEGQCDEKDLSSAEKEIALTATMRDWVVWAPHSANSNSSLVLRKFTATNPQDEENHWTLAVTPQWAKDILSTFFEAKGMKDRTKDICAGESEGTVDLRWFESHSLLYYLIHVQNSRYDVSPIIQSFPWGYELVGECSNGQCFWYSSEETTMGEKQLIYEGPYEDLSFRRRDRLKVYLEHDGAFLGRCYEPDRNVCPTRRMDENAVRVYSVNFHGTMAELIEVRWGGQELGGLFATGHAGTSHLIGKVIEGVAYVTKREPFELPEGVLGAPPILH